MLTAIHILPGIFTIVKNKSISWIGLPWIFKYLCMWTAYINNKIIQLAYRSISDLEYKYMTINYIELTTCLLTNIHVNHTDLSLVYLILTFLYNIQHALCEYFTLLTLCIRL